MVRLPRILMILVGVVAFSVGSVAAEPELASDKYLEYLEVLADAEEFEQIVPYWAKWMGKSAKKRGAQELEEKLRSMKEMAARRTTVYVSGASGDSSKTTLTVGGREAFEEGDQTIDIYLSGEVVMIQEKGRWVIDSESWWSV